ncbi:carbamoyltransferase [Mangrovicoccus sp. HB161399]|uniref:carbamoyltransferase family protein n=1 Tax=Mangrovicoccus sp. HB161399 TaxID=2720392 RepID=UPI001552A300|nr:carbamoyltransferase [Mangrovicoccus sp. HB161399]
MKILGLSAYYHDSAAALVEDGRIVAAAQEERFSRRKFDPAFPSRAIRACLETAGWQPGDIGQVVFHEQPGEKFRRLVATHAALAPDGFWSFRAAMPGWIGGKLFTGAQIRRELRRISPDFAAPLAFAAHHQSHAASAFYPSPFEDAAILTLDGVGEWSCASMAAGSGNAVELLKEQRFPHSPGLLYSALTQYLGFKVLSGEYKVMGLAPYGQPVHARTMLDNLLDLRGDGSFRLDMDYFGFAAGQSMITARMEALFGRKRRGAEDPLLPFHMDMAASLQAVIEEILRRMVRNAVAETGMRDLCMAGGVALNSVANGKILAEGLIDRLWVQPAAGDAGAALGAALAYWHGTLGQPREILSPDAMQGALLGPAHDPREAEARLRRLGAALEVHPPEEIDRRVAAALSEGQVAGWMQGRMEFGPRALGSRSILADPRHPGMQKTLNLKVKYRESFRPFAPAVMAGHADGWFALNGPSPYMLEVVPLKEERRHIVNDPGPDAPVPERLALPRSDIPAVTHLDYSARVQTVDPEVSPRFHALLSAFHDATGCPILVNTSFNLRGEPIVESPEDAYRCFMGSEIDLLVVEDCLMTKAAQPAGLLRDYRDDLAPD